MLRLSALALICLPLAASAADDGFAPLFSGKDLTGWTMAAKPNPDGSKGDPSRTWSVVDGTIRCTGKPNGYLATTKEYGDFVLRVKWRFPEGSKGGNSGVLLRVQEDKYWPVSYEAQLKTGAAGELWLSKATECSLDVDKARHDPQQSRRFLRLTGDEKVEKPFGEWNQYEIICKGGDIAVSVNGKKVNEGSNASLKRGRIALQSEGVEIHFKDIQIKELK